ncbi:Putative ribonuclease H protein At1g65750, partial [Linum perenne]
RENNLLFGITAWFLWKARNESVFANKTVSPSQLMHKCLFWVNNFCENDSRIARCTEVRKHKIWKQVAWESGPLDWVVVNTDGSVSSNTSKAAAGGLIRDHEGRALVAFTMNLGCCTVTQAELKGAITGLNLAWSHGFCRVELQIDSKAVVSVLTCPEIPTHQHAIEVLEFKELCRRD